MTSKKFLLKVHNSYRWVVGICDQELFGRILTEGEKQLDLSGQFFEGKELNEDGLKKEIRRCLGEDATFNIVGENSVQVARELGLVTDEGIQTVDGVPFALVLL